VPSSGNDFDGLALDIHGLGRQTDTDVGFSAILATISCRWKYRPARHPRYAAGSPAGDLVTVFAALLRDAVETGPNFNTLHGIDVITWAISASSRSKTASIRAAHRWQPR
jgi:hypothetical protein